MGVCKIECVGKKRGNHWPGGVNDDGGLPGDRDLSGGIHGLDDLLTHTHSPLYPVFANVCPYFYIYIHIYICGGKYIYILV